MNLKTPLGSCPQPPAPNMSQAQYPTQFCPMAVIRYPDVLVDGLTNEQMVHIWGRAETHCTSAQIKECFNRIVGKRPAHQAISKIPGYFGAILQTIGHTTTLKELYVCFTQQVSKQSSAFDSPWVWSELTWGLLDLLVEQGHATEPMLVLKLEHDLGL